MVAVLHATSKAGVSALRFVQAVGVDPATNKTRTMTFDFNATNATGGVEVHTMSVPVLSMVPISFMRVRCARFPFNTFLVPREHRGGSQMKEALFEFDLRVLSTKQSEFSSQKALTSQLPDAFFTKYSRIAVLGATLKIKNSNRYVITRESRPNLFVSLQVCQANLPTGIAKMLAVLDDASISVPVEA
jgi:hypothetical protein